MPYKRRITLWKEVGETPLQAIEKWKQVNPAYAEIPASYAGRLDPMAEGKLLILLGDECKKQDRYRGLDKEYEIEVLLDLSTDTGDVLGMPAYASRETVPADEDIRRVLHDQTGTKILPYPAFSSKTVNGKPLFLYALEGTLDSISIPKHEETIHRIRLMRHEVVSKDTLQERIERMLALAPRNSEPSKALGADFRQDAIRAEWNTVFENMGDRSFSVLSLRVTCGSGTYMRTLAERIGKELGTSGIALSIKRSKIGTYHLFGFWIRLFR